jgi:lysophospholipase L1-like esterase
MLIALAVLAAAAVTPATTGARSRSVNRAVLPACPSTRWIESWSAPPSDSDSSGDARLMSFVHGPSQTLRTIITPHFGGSLIRVRLSNRYGSGPVTFDHVAVAASQTGASLVPGTSQAVQFQGKPSITVPAGADAVSDPVTFTFTAFQNLAVSTYLANTYIPTEHFSGRQTSYGTTPAAGDHVTDAGNAAFTQSTTARYFVSGLDVQAPGAAGTVVAFGDSITDGYQGGASLVPETASTLDLNARYPDWLSRRLLAAHLPLTVANAGISGNRLLQDGQIPMFGQSGLTRFTNDAIDVPGVRTIIILEGTNDIGQSNATADEIIAGLTRLVQTAKAAHIRVLLGTLTPMENATEPGTYSGTASNAVRLAVNTWIRTQHLADGFVDFSKAVEDPVDPGTMAAPYDGGDGLHFTPAGYHALADAIDLAQLHAPVCGQQPALRLTISPRRVTIGRRVTMRLRVTVRRDGRARPVRRAVITVGRHRVRSGATGRARLILRFHRSGPVRVRASAPGYRTATRTLIVKARAAG